MNENLNKAFWDDLQKKYPKSHEHFMVFIDKYKLEIMWSRLFQTNFIDRDIQFEDIPLEMQVGVIYKYVLLSFDDITVTLNNQSAKQTMEQKIENCKQLFKFIEGKMKL